MKTNLKRNLALIAVFTALALALAYYRSTREITVFASTDQYSHLQLTHSCVWNGLEMHFYVTVRAPNSRLISRTEIAPSADMRQDCLEQPFFRARSIKPDSNYSRLKIEFEDERREPVYIPLNLVGIDGLPESIQQPRSSN